MSKYTTEVRYICESYSGVTQSVGYYGIDDTIAKAIPKIFDFHFPIYDESYRNVLCTKILKHYYTREIGSETVGLWKHWLDTRLNEIMPYYNQLYKSAMIEFDPMHDIELTTKHTRDNDDTSENSQSGTTSASSESVDRNLYSDTPQGALDNVENEAYLTNATKVTSDGTSTGNFTNTGKTTAKTTEEYVQTITGKTGGSSYSKRLLEFRSTFINIDLQIINNLNDLFMNLW